MPSESNLALIAKLNGMIHECLKDYVSCDEPVAMVDFPDYRNVGDSAIWLGQMAYLSSRFNKSPSYISALPDHSHDKLDKAMPSGPILITGGGTFGDIWPGHQELRESILERWPGRLVVQLPQSIHYKSQQRADRDGAGNRAPQELRVARARRGIEAVRAEALRLPGAPLPGHGVRHRRRYGRWPPHDFRCWPCCERTRKRRQITIFPPIPMSR